MSLHRLLSVIIAVPNVAETAQYYADFGLASEGHGWFATADAGRQLRIEYAPTRRLVEMRVAADDADDAGDLTRAAAGLARLDVPAQAGEAELETAEPVTGMRVRIEVAPRLEQATGAGQHLQRAGPPRAAGRRVRRLIDHADRLSIGCRADERVTGGVQIRLICVGGVVTGLLPR
jgi:hypothetical protein